MRSVNRIERIIRAKPDGKPLPQPQGHFGDPLPGLTVDEIADFAIMQLQFQEKDTVASGLGPVYNNVSCVACHSSPAIGGASAIIETRFGKMTKGQFDPLTSEGGSLLQQSAINPACQETIPADANVVAGSQDDVQLFGLGLYRGDSRQHDHLRISIKCRWTASPGRPPSSSDVATNVERVGRFGWK